MNGFLSYAHEDSETAEKLFLDLENAGFRLWFDRRRMREGKDVDVWVLNAIRECYFFVVLLSATSVSKHGYIRKEIRLAMDMVEGLSLDESFIIPVRIAKCEPRPDEIAGLRHSVDMFQNWVDGLRQLIALLRSSTSDAIGIRGDSAHDLQLKLSNFEYFNEIANQLVDRSAIAVFLENCLRRFKGIDPRLLSHKIRHIERDLDDLVACIELHFVEHCGSLDEQTECPDCGAKGTIIHGVIDYGGYSQMDHNDNYVSFCSNCYWAYHLYQIDYNGTGPLTFNRETSIYG